MHPKWTVKHPNGADDQISRKHHNTGKYKDSSLRSLGDLLETMRELTGLNMSAGQSTQFKINSKMEFTIYTSMGEFCEHANDPNLE